MAWNYRPYQNGNPERSLLICRIAQKKNSCVFQWVDASSEICNEYVFCYGEAGKKVTEISVKGTEVSVEMEPGHEYLAYVKDKTGRVSPKRPVSMADFIGTVVNYLHPDDKQYIFSGKYICSPSITKMQNGTLIMTMDVYEHDYPQNLSMVFASYDEGKSWTYLCDLFPCFWGRVFAVGNDLYMIATTTEYGELQIGKSVDGGNTWTDPVIIAPKDEKFPNGYHRAPMPLLHYENKILFACETGSWEQKRFDNFIVWADADKDLLEPSNWNRSEKLDLLKEIQDRGVNIEKRSEDIKLHGTVNYSPGAIEGNLVLNPKRDKILCLMRYSPNCAVVLEAFTDGRAPKFINLLDFPMAHSKFVIQEKGGIYYTLGNPYPGRARLSLYLSTDLQHWILYKDIVNLPSANLDKDGFQYPDFIFEGDDMLMGVRTALNGAHNFHDSNCITFFRIDISDAKKFLDKKGGRK